MKDFVFIEGPTTAFLNLDNIAWVTPSKDNPATHTTLIGPGMQIELGMVYADVRVLIEKLIKDRYEFDARYQEYARKQQEEMLNRWSENHTHK